MTDNELLVSPFLIYGDQVLANFIESSFKAVTGKNLFAASKTKDANLKNAFNWARTQSKKFKKIEINYRLSSFSNFKEDEYVSFNFQEILTALLMGKIKKILVAKDQNIFGKINTNDATIEFTHFHKDYEDDDLLDDIAQLAIEQGVSPLFVNSSQIINRRPIQAIISKDLFHDKEFVAKMEFAA
jgi:hypothetical protein